MNEQKNSEGMEIKQFAPRNFSLFAVLLGILVVVSAYNQFQIMNISNDLSTLPISAKLTSSAATSNTQSSTSLDVTDVRPKGTPAIYSSELGVAYDGVSESDPALADQTIKKLAAKDTEITLSGADLQRYIKITSAISCEYCCGVQSLIFSNGQPACGCAHSYAMRGLAKYLIKTHGSQYTDDQILEELGKWKVLFFPAIHAQKAEILKQNGIEINYINLASNKYRGIEKGASGGKMVGGC